MQKSSKDSFWVVFISFSRIAQAFWEIKNLRFIFLQLFDIVAFVSFSRLCKSFSNSCSFLKCVANSFLFSCFKKNCMCFEIYVFFPKEFPCFFRCKLIYVFASRQVKDNLAQEILALENGIMSAFTKWFEKSFFSQMLQLICLWKCYMALSHKYIVCFTQNRVTVTKEMWLLIFQIMLINF